MAPKIISHRANLEGSNPLTENTIESIDKAIETGFDVEVDAWFINGKIWLGHDREDIKFFNNMEEYFIKNSSKLWIHCKNLDAIEYLLKFPELNIFGHSNDDYVLTSKLNIFSKPGVSSNKNSIIVMPEMTPVFTKESLFNCYGILTDYPMCIKKNDLKLFIK